MLEYFVSDSFNFTQTFILIIGGIVTGLGFLLFNCIGYLRDQHKNGKHPDGETITVSVISVIAIVILVFLMSCGILKNQQLDRIAQHDAIARHYNLKRDGNHLLLTLKDSDEANDFKDNILLDLSSETKDSYHVIFHDGLYNIPKSDKKQTTRIENTKE